MSISLENLVKKYPLPSQPVSVEEYLCSFIATPLPLERPSSANMTPRPSSSNITPIPFRSDSVPNPIYSTSLVANRVQHPIPAIELKIMGPNGPYAPMCDLNRRISAAKIQALTNMLTAPAYDQESLNTMARNRSYEQDWLEGLTQARSNQLKNNMGYY